MRARVWIVSACALAIINGCSPRSPAKVCAASDTQNQIYSLIFDSTEHALATLGSLDVGDTTAARNVLEEMRRQHMLGFDFTTLDGYDNVTKKIRCSGKIRLRADVQDQTSQATGALTIVGAAVSTAGIPMPEGLSSGSATSQIAYGRQPSAADSDTFVYSVEDAKEIVGGLLAIALERSAIQAARTQPTAGAPEAETADTSTVTPAPDVPAENSASENKADDNDAYPSSNPPPPPPSQSAPTTSGPNPF